MGAAMNRTAIARMRVAELREELASRGLDHTGLRPVLQVRLTEGELLTSSECFVDVEFLLFLVSVCIALDAAMLCCLPG